MTWHHVIPLNCLTTVWNGLVDGEHWEAAGRYLHVAGAKDAGQLTELMKAGAVEGEVKDKVHELVTWQGWNIVEGPGGSCRRDDPEERYDQFGWPTLSNNQRSTLLAVDALYRQMQPLQLQLDPRAPSPITADQAKRFAKTLWDKQSVLRNKSPIAFTERMWTKEDAGRPGRRKPSYSKKLA